MSKDKNVTKTHKNIKKYPYNSENPFKDQVIAHVQSGIKKIFTTNTDKADKILDAETGEVRGHALFYKEIKVDRAQFTKIYASSFDEFSELSRSGLKMLDYITKSLKPNQDFILFDVDKAKDITGYTSNRSIVNGLSELLEFGFIARGNKNYIYFINPTIYFNGDRMDLVRRYVVQPHEEDNNISIDISKRIE